MSEVRDKLCFYRFEIDLGKAVVAWDNKGLRALCLGDTYDSAIDDLKQRFEQSTLSESAEYCGDLENLKSAIAGTTEFSGRLAPVGTQFQTAVWSALQNISRGRKITYSQLAHSLSCPNSARAVANACGANPIAVLIPCHRVVRSDGAHGGYRWGMEMKKELLSREEGQPDAA